MKKYKARSGARNILPDEIGLFLQQENVNDFKSMCKDFWERCSNNKMCIFDSNNEYT